MTSSNLKVIACLSMLIDHIGAILFPNILVFRILGRIAFPIFAFLIVEGYFHTKNVQKYLFRLGIFALISEIPFDRAFNGAWLELGSQNVFFTLFIGLITIYVYDHLNEKYNTLGVVFIICLTILSEFIRSDYGAFGILMIFIFYKNKDNKGQQALWLFIINGLMAVLSSMVVNTISLRSIIQIFALLSLPIIFIYNGKKGLRLKYFFYLFYPLHLIILYGINLYCIWFNKIP